MDLDALFRGSFINWEAVEVSWSKKTVSSRLMLFAARAYIAADPEREPDPVRQAFLKELHRDVIRAFATPPTGPEDPAAEAWGEFIDRALAAELETIPYGERPPTLYEIRTGLDRAAEEAGRQTPLGRWFLQRARNLPGADLPEDPGYMPV